MKFAVLIFFIFLAFQSHAQVSPQRACQDFKNIQRFTNLLTEKNIDELLPKADWVDEKVKRNKLKRTAGFVGKLVMAALIGKVNPLSFLADPTPAAVSSMTGSFTKSPKDFARFYELTPKSACFYLGMPDTHANLLRRFTHELWLELEYSRGH